MAQRELGGHRAAKRVSDHEGSLDAYELEEVRAQVGGAGDGVRVDGAAPRVVFGSLG